MGVVAHLAVIPTAGRYKWRTRNSRLVLKKKPIKYKAKLKTQS